MYTKPGLHTWIYGSFEIFFKDNFDYLGLSLYVLTLETNLLQEVRWDFTLRDGGGAQTWKSFLKAKGNTDKGKKETTNVNFCVTTLATPSNLGKEVVGSFIKQLRGLGWVIQRVAYLLTAREMQWPGAFSEPPLMTLPDLVLKSLGPAQPWGCPLSLLTCLLLLPLLYIWRTRGPSSLA